MFTISSRKTISSSRLYVFLRTYNILYMSHMIDKCRCLFCVAFEGDAETVVLAIKEDPSAMNRRIDGTIHD